MQSIRLWAVAAIAAMALTMGACGGDDDGGGGGDGGGDSGEGLQSSGEDKGTLAFNLAGKQIPYYVDLAEGMKAEADRLGWELTESFGNQEVPLQITQVENLLAKQPDGLVVGPIDQEAMIPPYRRAFEAGIPIATVSDDIGDDGKQYQLAYVGHAYEELGKKKAQWIVDQLGGKGKVGIVHAIRGGNFTEEQGKGANAVFGANPDIEVVDGPYVGDFTAQVGLDGTQNLLSRAPDLDAIYFDNDDIALGGVQAVKERGIDLDDILIVGTDGGEPALKAVQSGEIDYTISLCGFAQGAAAVRTLVDFIKDGKRPPALVETEQVAFTTETIDDQLAELTKEQCNGAVDTAE